HRMGKSAMHRILSWMLAGCLLLVAGAVSANGGMTLEQLAQVRNVSQALLSPDGSRVAYTLVVPRGIGVDEDGPAWSELRIVDRNGNDRGYVTGKVNVSGLAWMPGGRELAYLAKRQGDEHRVLYRIPVDGGESRVMARLGSDITAFSLSPDGRRAAL